MFLEGWSLDHLCRDSSRGLVSRHTPRHHPCVEPESLGWGPECGTSFLRWLQCTCCRESDLQVNWLVLLLIFRKGKRNSTMLFAKLVTNLKFLNHFLCENNLSILGSIHVLCICQLRCFFFPKLAKRNISSKCYRHYITKNYVFKMTAF